MSLQQQQQQQQHTAEKSVQTHDLSAPATVLFTNNPENAAAEVANTLVSMATGRQRTVTAVKPLNVINVSNQSSLPILSLADYTTPHGVPTASALANQAKLRPTQQDEAISNSNSLSMSTEEYNQTSSDSSSTTNSRRGKSNRSTSKSKKDDPVETIQYGPISVKPRKHVAPTLANGRRSKDESLPPEEDYKRRLRRDRNKLAAAKCRRKRNELREILEKNEQRLAEQEQVLQKSVQSLTERKQQLEFLLNHHACMKKTNIPITSAASNTLNVSKTDMKTIPTATTFDPNNSKRVTINLTNAQELFGNASIARIATTTTTDPSMPSSASVPMITIHILPDVAHALLGSTGLDRNKLADILQQTNANNSFIATTSNMVISDPANTHISMNRTS